MSPDILLEARGHLAAAIRRGGFPVDLFGEPGLPSTIQALVAEAVRALDAAEATGRGYGRAIGLVSQVVSKIDGLNPEAGRRARLTRAELAAEEDGRS